MSVDCGSCGADLATVSRDADFVERSTRLLISVATPIQRQVLNTYFAGQPPDVLCAGCFCEVFSQTNGVAFAQISAPNGIEQPAG